MIAALKEGRRRPGNPHDPIPWLASQKGEAGSVEEVSTSAEPASGR